MNLIEARKSGKWYKRVSWINFHNNDDIKSLTFEDIDADDYIFAPDQEPVKKKVTVYRPIFREGCMYKAYGYWSENKKDTIPDGREDCGWEEKEIEVTE